MMNDQNRPDPINIEKPHCKELLRPISFLLSMWCVDETGRSHWRASLKMPETGKRIGFASLEQLFVYLIDFCENQNGVEDNEAK